MRLGRKGSLGSIEGVLVVAVSRESPVAVERSPSCDDTGGGGEIFLLGKRDLCSHGGGHLGVVRLHVLGKVGSRGVEARLVSEPFDGIDDPVRADKLVAASHHTHPGVVDLPQGARRLLLDPVRRLVAVVPPGYYNM